MERIAAGDRMYSETLAIKDAEIAEWRAKDEANTRTIGVLTKQIVMLTLSRQKRLVVGPQVGYGLNGYHVGVGVTLDIGLRFKAPVWQG
jgi:hypothetical protein